HGHGLAVGVDVDAVGIHGLVGNQRRLDLQCLGRGVHGGLCVAGGILRLLPRVNRSVLGLVGRGVGCFFCFVSGFRRGVLGRIGGIRRHLLRVFGCACGGRGGVLQDWLGLRRVVLGVLVEPARRILAGGKQRRGKQ